MNLSTLPFTLGFLELSAIALLVVLTAIAFLRKRPFTGWWIAAAISVIAAAILTPADLFSTLILAAMFFGMAILGSRIGASRKEPIG